MMARPGALLILSLVIVMAMFWSGLNWRLAARELRYFGLLLLIVLFSRAIFTPGKAMVALGPVQVTAGGVFTGLVICWRLVLIVVAGLIYTAVTRPREIRAAAQWLLGPLPGIPEKRVGVMIGLVVRFIPIILGQAMEITAAQKARCVECRKNPYYRLTCFARPMIRKTITQADHLTLAMMSRCYQGSATPPGWRLRASDGVAFGVVIALVLILIGSHFIFPLTA